MHIALKSIKKLFQNPPKIIKNLHQIASKSILQRLLWAPLMRPLAPFLQGCPNRPKTRKQVEKGTCSTSPGWPFWESKLQEKVNWSNFQCFFEVRFQGSFFLWFYLILVIKMEVFLEGSTCLKCSKSWVDLSFQVFYTRSFFDASEHPNRLTLGGNFTTNLTPSGHQMWTLEGWKIGQKKSWKQFTRRDPGATGTEPLAPLKT